MADLSPIETARFWSRIRSGTDFQCWEWQGRSNPQGYGRYAGMAAHRIAYELLTGPIPEGMVVRHKCDNPPCCNPRHLTVGTQAENMQDKVNRGRHAVGSESPRAKITETVALDILRNPDGLKQCDLAKRHGIAKSTVSMIRSGERWAHLAR